MEKPFNPTFFATVAVIIPVIFLALAIQSDYLARTFLASRRMAGISRSQLKERSILRQAWSFPIMYIGWLLGVLGLMVMAYGAVGEFLSLLALEQRQAMVRSQTIVMQSVDLLLLAAVVASIWRIIEAISKAEKEDRRVPVPSADTERVSAPRDD